MTVDCRSDFAVLKEGRVSVCEYVGQSVSRVQSNCRQQWCTDREYDRECMSENQRDEDWVREEIHRSGRKSQ